MKRRTAEYACLLFFFVVRCGQAQSVDLPHTFQRDPQQGLLVTVTNDRTIAVTALLIVTRQLEANGKLRAEHFRYMDAAVQQDHDRELLPGETRAIRILSKEALSLPGLDPKIEAVLFSNGAQAGSDLGTGLLRAGRRKFLDDLVLAEQLLAEARVAHLNRDEALSKFRALFEERKQLRPSTRPEQFVGMVGSLVPTWLVHDFEGLSAVCDATCTESRIADCLGRIQSWKARATRE